MAIVNFHIDTIINVIILLYYLLGIPVHNIRCMYLKGIAKKILLFLIENPYK